MYLLPAAARPDRDPQTPEPRGHWGFLDRIVMHAALKATRGMAFNADFLTGFLVRQMCQARELTVLLESKEMDEAVAPAVSGGANG